ncbi:MAG: acyl-ACP--UDP-N-acetylglucosamine O-acyltransferase [Ignavibacteriales bacterium]|nr:acyl-ACP--UDP-N-acetylglucosamine O-acyltransferase [Ignavibacteriales bacterium]
MAHIHNTAVVAEGAKIGENVAIGPFAVVHADVEIGDESVVGPHAVIYDGARIGRNVKVHQGAAVANIPQDLKFGGEPTRCYVGDNTTIREFVTVNRGTTATGETRLGANCLLMAYAHIGHDSAIGDHVILANAVQVGGHVEIDEWTIVGGSTPIHQFCKIGKHAMIGGGFRAVQDVPPFVTMGGEPLRFAGVNSIGLRRRGFTSDQILTLKTIYRYIYGSGYTLTDAKARIVEEFGDDDLAKETLDFLGRTTRGLAG